MLAKINENRFVTGRSDSKVQMNPVILKILSLPAWASKSSHHFRKAICKESPSILLSAWNC
jgi:hypothetical protein